MNSRPDRREHLERDAYLLVKLATNRLSTELELVCRAEGITEAQYSVLWVVCLSATRRGVVQGEISDGLVTRAADVSRVVARLEAAELVRRTRDSDDGRVYWVTPTPEGRALFRRATTQIKALHRRQFGDLSDRELSTLLGLLNRVFWSHSIDES